MQAKSTTPKPRGPRGPYKLHGPRTTSVCAQCKRIYEISQSDLDRGRGIYCGHKCRGEARERPLEERFWHFVEKTDSCWNWNGSGTRFGHGQIRAGKDRGYELLLAHRVAWELQVGPIPMGAMVLHNCPGGDNPRCVRGEHLFLGTQKDNMTDALAKGRLDDRRRADPENVHRGEAHHNCRVTEAQVREMRARHAAGEKRKALAAEYGLSHSVAGDIFAFRSWKHVK